MSRATRKDLHERTRRGRQITERNRTQLIESEFSVAFTMYDLAATEFRVGNRPHGLELLGRVKDAIQSARAHMEHADVAPERLDDMRRQLAELEGRLNELERRAA